MQICEQSKCTGCFACRNVCPKQAIDVHINEYGESLPKINEDKCISCGLCQKVCPSNQTPTLNKAKKAFAAWSKADEDIKSSSSGGVAAVFSRYVIESGGLVYGAAVADCKTKHICITSTQEIEKLRGSKYVQSDIGLIYKDVKQRLLEGKFVLFTGTPCQIAGLKGFLQKDYDNLITVDLICHGTSPHTYLEEHLKMTSNNWNSYSFRGKYNYYMTAYDSNGKIVYKRHQLDDEYFLAFSKKLSLRDICYNCFYAQKSRVSDITIGDFWGLDRSVLSHEYAGRISVVLPNTSKGSSFFSLCSDHMVVEERAIDEAFNKEQGCLLHPSTMHPDRVTFKEELISKGFDKAVRNTDLWKSTAKEQRIKWLKSNLIARCLRKVLRLLHLKK